MKSIAFTFLEPGNKVLIVHRRLFPQDRPRFFLGVVEGFNERNGLLKVTGHSFGPTGDGGLGRKNEPATKILALTSGTLIVYQLGGAVDLDRAFIEVDVHGRVALKDENGPVLDLNESLACERNAL